jgi:glycosyltransferase involved in cell wall biosynthesis
MINVLAFALYGTMAASTRYRLEQYAPGLRELGVNLHIHHLLGDDYLHRRFTGLNFSASGLLKAGFNRLGELLTQRKFDAVMLHCELFPLLPGWVERAMLRRPYVYDFDDAFYLRYQGGKMGLVRPLLGEKFDTVMAGAAAITAGNHVLADYAARHNLNTQYLPTVVDTKRYKQAQESRGKGVFTVGWIGSPSTAPYLSDLVSPLSKLAEEGRIRFVVIGGKAPNIPNVDVVEMNWSEETEVDLINSFDVGVMPLPDDAWARGKCAFKLIQYMACAVPVVASPVGANVELVSNGCGLLATTSDDWIEAIRLLRDQPRKRVDMGQAGRERVEQRYSLHVNLPVLASVLRQAAGRS